VLILYAGSTACQALASLGQGLLKVVERGENKTFFSYAFGEKTQRKLKEVEMESDTEDGQDFDMGSLYAQLCGLQDIRKARGKRYPLATLLTLLVSANLCGGDKPSGISDRITMGNLAIGA
jgi:hypothetical protein